MKDPAVMNRMERITRNCGMFRSKPAINNPPQVIDSLDTEDDDLTAFTKEVEKERELAHSISPTGPYQHHQPPTSSQQRGLAIDKMAQVRARTQERSLELQELRVRCSLQRADFLDNQAHSLRADRSHDAFECVTRGAPLVAAPAAMVGGFFREKLASMDFGSKLLVLVGLVVVAHGQGKRALDKERKEEADELEHKAHSTRVKAMNPGLGGGV